MNEKTKQTLTYTNTNNVNIIHNVKNYANSNSIQKTKSSTLRRETSFNVCQAQLVVVLK